MKVHSWTIETFWKLIELAVSGRPRWGFWPNTSKWSRLMLDQCNESWRIDQFDSEYGPGNYLIFDVGRRLRIFFFFFTFFWDLNAELARIWKHSSNEANIISLTAHFGPSDHLHHSPMAPSHSENKYADKQKSDFIQHETMMQLEGKKSIINRRIINC